MPDPKSLIIRKASKKVLTEFKRQNLPPDPDLIQVSIIAKINMVIESENKDTDGPKLKYVQSLPSPVIAEILLKFYSIVFLTGRIANDCGILAICQSDSAGKVFYNTDETEITKIIRQYQYDISDRSIRETLTHLQDQAPRVYLDPDPVLVPYKFSSDTRGRLPDELIVDKLAATGEFRILKSGSSSDGRLIVRHYENGVRTGIWEIVNITGPDKNYGTPGVIITNLGGVISPSRKQNILLSLRDRLKNTAGGRSSILLEGFDNCLVPCRNGVYDMKDHTFTEYTDPAFLDKYGEIPFTYKLDTAFNPDALKNIPQKWDPLLGLAELFAGKTPRAHELADATRATIQNQCDARAGTVAKAAITDRSIEACCLRVLLTMFQLAVRNYSGREGNIIFFDNLAGQAAGHNGKSTAADMIKFIIDHGSIPDYATRTSQPVFFVYTNGKRVLTVPIDSWGNDFAFGDDIRSALLICSDELRESGKIPSPGIVKNFARRQAVHHNAKYKPQFDFAFRGVLLHLQNGASLFEAKDAAMFEHSIHLRFEQDFSRQSGSMDSKIKSDYIVDEDIAEYMLALILSMDFVDDYDPEDLKQLEVNKDAVVYENKPVYRFLDQYFDDVPLYKHSVEIMMDLFENWCRLERENVHGQIKKAQFRADVDEWCGRHKDRFEVQFDRDWRYTQYEIVYMTSTRFSGLESYGGKTPLTSTKYSQPYHQIEDPTNEGYFLRRAITKKFRHQVIDLSHQPQFQSPAQNPPPQPQP